jgi:hypothetical protein
MVRKITVGIYFSIGSLFFNHHGARASEPYCDQIALPDIVHQLAGEFDFHGSDIFYRSQDERTQNASIYRYRYCIQNTHPYMPVIILWKDQANNSMKVFDRIVPQQTKRPEFHDSVASYAVRQLQIFYGSQKTRWDGNIIRDAIYQKEGWLPTSPLIQYVQFDSNTYDLQAILANPEQTAKLVLSGTPIALVSGAIIDIPADNDDLFYLNGLVQRSNMI